jgi:enoyl-CoA hydratase/carnithine racemase
MREALIETLAQANADGSVRAVVITGAGDRAFCSGQDLSETIQYTIADIDDG